MREELEQDRRRITCVREEKPETQLGKEKPDNYNTAKLASWRKIAGKRTVSKQLGIIRRSALAETVSSAR